MRWPVRKFNTVLNICHNGENVIIERFGKFHKIQPPGLFFAIPFIDKISYVVNQRETTIEIDPQSTITKDNVLKSPTK